MPQHQAASGQFDRNVNPADGVGSLKHGPRTHPAHAEGCLVYKGSDLDGQNGNPGLNTMGFSCDGLIQQLSSAAGSKYTVAEATYAANKAGICR